MSGLNLFSLTLMLGKIWEILSKDNVTMNDWSFAIAMLSFFAFTLHILLNDTQIITIDIDKVTYKNWLTGKTKQFDFKDLDGFVTENQGGQSGNYEVVFLTKGTKRFGKISSFYYSNYIDLIHGLKGLKYLGHEPFDILKSIKRRLTE